MADPIIGNEDFPKMKKGRYKNRKKDFEHMSGFRKYLQTDQSNVNKLNLLKKIGIRAHRRRILRLVNLLLLKRRSGN